MRVGRGNDERKKVSLAQLFAQSEERGGWRRGRVGVSSAEQVVGLETGDCA